MQKSTSYTTTAVILFSILTIVLEFTAYYFLKVSLLAFIITALLALLFCHTVLVLGLHFEACFSYQLLHLLMWGIILFLLYVGNDSDIITYSARLFLFPVIHWICCIIYCTLRNLWDEGSRYTNFKKYFRNSSILFLLLYTVFLVLWLFLHNTDYSYNKELSSLNLVPFFTLAGFITDFMDKNRTLSQIFFYLADRVLVYLPYGFFIILLMKRSSRLVRFLLLLLFPLVIEGLQALLSFGRCDIEDILYGLLGGFIGALLYHLLNRTFRNVKGMDFLETSRRFYSNRSSLHF
ncbi:VanZ family protein [Anaerocolumna xylanovorans]|uniref:VanZ like family protein n=1 Tax=Anaerocolumna xylanovorans DSM 12503 TaxID=1121345 RepID=A0A1M7Y5R1_9FIRM|nr:VanZ family protein [Anaerocolumna xylanovorans]SHO47822.1 VanZ like family protein [Anaerocolumna xylanovorans DSM 12503]